MGPVWPESARPASRGRKAAWSLTAATLAIVAGLGAVAARPADMVPTKTDRVVAAPVTPPPVVEPTAVPVTPPPAAPPARSDGGTRVLGYAAPAPPPVPNGWVEIPALGVRAPVVPVGVDSRGDMVTPRNARDVAWLDDGSFPGPTRNALLAGHRNWRGRQGSFGRLEHLKAGDAVHVGILGATHTFVVTWVQIVDPDVEDHSPYVGPTSVDSVTLVTCGGQFNRSTRHYEMRVVVRAERTG